MLNTQNKDEKVLSYNDLEKILINCKNELVYEIVTYYDGMLHYMRE